MYSQPLILCLRGNDNYNSYHDLVAGTGCPWYNGPSSNFIEFLGYVSLDTPTAASLASAALKAQVTETTESDPSGVDRRSASASAVLSTTTRWALVGISQTVRDGAGNLLDETRAFYDNLATFGAVDRGDLTFVQKRAIGNASIDRKLSYDANGALESETVYADYGTLGVMTNTSGALRRTSNVFDSGTGMYVTQQRVFGADTTPQTRTVNYAYYGVGGESVTNTLGARQPVGALKAVTDANQAVTGYGYDVFGRLRTLARPGDSLADPSEEWRYYDGVETSRTMTASGFSQGPFVSDHRVRGISGGGWTSATLATLDRTIYDGLGRVIQTQTRAGQGWELVDCADSPRKTLGAEIHQSTLYDALGRAAIQTVPYTQTQYESCASQGWVNTPYVAMPQTQTVAAGTGLNAVYYNGMAFETAVLNRTDATVNFDWGTGSPGGGVSSDQFSARWTGWVRVDASATYTLYAAGDDGIRLWINGQLVVDQWHDQGGTEYAAAVALQAGVYHELKFEYYEHDGGAVARLKWASPTLAKQAIPMANLHGTRVTPVVTPTVPYVRTAYDALGRPVAEIAPDGTQTRHWYVI
ncbi:MAG: PA14 domain-containing protein, partial [Thermoflexales bacterium]